MSGSDQPCRCAWAGSDPLYRRYHDEEWGVPERDAFRLAFEGFDPERIAGYDAGDVERLLADAGIVRSRAKIVATIGNARAYLAMRERGEDFADFIWSFSGGRPVQSAWTSVREVPAQTPMAVEMSKALKARGFKFTGPVIVYAFLQATGVVNDHVVDCFRHQEVKRLG